MNRISNKVKGLKLSPFLTCFLLGVIYALPYYFGSLFFLTFISLTAFFVFFLGRERKKRFFRYFYAFYLGFYFALYLWLSKLYPFAGFDFTPFQGAVIIMFACIGIPLYHALIHSLIMLLTKLLPDNSYITALGFCAAWIISEWFMALGPFGFSWGRAALSQIGLLFSVQTVSLFGSYFITAVVICSCMLLAVAITDKKRFYAIIGCMIIFTNFMAGTVLYFIPVNLGESMRVAVLQGNAASGEKWEKNNLERIKRTYISMAREAALNGAELIVLPESAVPMRFVKDGELYEEFAEITSEYNVIILAGVLMYDKYGSYNSVIAVYPDGSLSERYDKRHLVPFGEYIPFEPLLRAVFPFIYGLNLGGMDTVPGEGTEIIDINGIKNGSLVCFDSIFDGLSRKSVLDGAEILTLVTNDSWFKDSAGIRQHLGHAMLRAVENRRYIIRAANTGISAFISPKGDVYEPTEALTEAVIYYDVYSVSGKTLYTYAGNLILYAAFAFQTIIIIRFFIKKKVKGI